MLYIFFLFRNNKTTVDTKPIFFHRFLLCSRLLMPPPRMTQPPSLLPFPQPVSSSNLFFRVKHNRLRPLQLETLFLSRYFSLDSSAANSMIIVVASPLFLCKGTDTGLHFFSLILQRAVVNRHRQISAITTVLIYVFSRLIVSSPSNYGRMLVISV